MSLLSHDAYLSTMGATREPVGPNDAPPVDFWPYVQSIEEHDLGGFDISAGEVSNAWVIDGGRWQHVLIDSATPNVFLVVVLDGHGENVFGHFLLNLNQHYGVEP